MTLDDCGPSGKEWSLYGFSGRVVVVVVAAAVEETPAPGAGKCSFFEKAVDRAPLGETTPRKRRTKELTENTLIL
jgi:hypothetical protein